MPRRRLKVLASVHTRPVFRRRMRRREFITILGTAAVTWPLSARAQKPPNRTRRIGVLMGTQEQSQDDSGLQDVIGRLERLGWKQGLTAKIDILWSHSDVALMRRNAQILVELSPDVILCHSNPALAQLSPLSGNTPIVCHGRRSGWKWVRH